MAPLIALEGIDGSGKGTQAQRLCDTLTARGQRVELLSFPRYADTFFGGRIGDYLNGRFGDLDAVDPFLVSLLYSADRFESADVLQAARSRSDLVLLDRYVHSNVAHQVAKAVPPRRHELRQWIEHVEHQLFRLPRPDRVFLFDLPVPAAQQLIRRKPPRSYTDRSADLQEADAEYLQRVRECYLELSREPGWDVVPVTSDGAFRPIEEITRQVLQLIDVMLSTGRSESPEG